MELKPDFVFTGLPPIATPVAEAASAESERTQDLTRDFRAPTHFPFPFPFPPLNPLGPLASLLGNWEGTGFNVIWRPFRGPSDHFLELNLTSETLQFEQIPGDIPNRGFLQQDINMHGLTYLQQIKDVNLNAGLHVEPGIWAVVPPTSDPIESFTVVRMASIPHGTTMLAQGLATHSVEPDIKTIDIIPFGVGGSVLTNPRDFPQERVLTNASNFRSPANQLVGIGQDMVDNPNIVLTKAIAGQKILSTIQLDVSTDTSASGTNTNILGGERTTPHFFKARAMVLTLVPTLCQLRYIRRSGLRRFSFRIETTRSFNCSTPSAYCSISPG